jgi:inner membrane protein
MKAPAHSIAGVTFSGTMCAFSNVNLFHDWRYLAVCGVCSILPDIDTQKSAIGSAVYPVAWLINRKFGHRTITHSLLFFVAFWMLLWSLCYFGVVTDRIFLKIALYALVSHYVLDMMTVSGIPLFYPFLRNPCVMPANPAYRFKTGDNKSEIIVFAVCALLCVTMQPLFEHGFWRTYNRAFATVQHVDRENQNTAFYIICEYSYIENAQERTGEAIVLESKKTELSLFDGRSIFTLSSDNPQVKINYTRPKLSDIEKKHQEIQFFNVTIDSLHHILQGKLSSGLVQSNYNVRYIKDAITYYTNFIQFKNEFDFQIYAGQDSSKSTIRANIRKLEAQISQHRQKYNEERQKWTGHNQLINDVTESLKNPNLSLYERNKQQKELMKLRNQSNDEPIYSQPIAQVAELEALKKSITESSLLFSGHLTLYQFGTQTAAAEPEQPIYEPQKSPLFASILIHK